ncbi:hypothetical protein [Parabacteroides sp. PF5-6]|uniref:exodeoxyribonuclease X C-terminal domain-containing protein n=1 Tax=Parabacteroides sp. PF5-6 TaxID=1742403 RepID=UPI00240650F1|nr:hypothetical protein [Parabacteroides sp. PF5-6]MDF9829755.1 hypothetical protein [Parabacteroides sp. PF5-6]
MKSKMLTPDDIMTFGKNRGLSFAEIYQYEPNYIEWLIFNTELYFDLELFEKLPNPTPMDIGAVKGSPEREKLFAEGKGSHADNINMYTGVLGIKMMLEAVPEYDAETKFAFSESAKVKNNTKCFFSGIEFILA